MDQIADLSELCRLCLESPPLLIPLSSKPQYATNTLSEIIVFCLDINCLPSDILPRNICQSCSENLKVAFELKTKSKESERTLLNIIQGQAQDDEEQLLTPYDPTASGNPPDFDEDELLLQPVEDDDEKYLNKTPSYDCKVCGKSFKYLKPFQNHKKTHESYKQDKVSPPKLKMQPPYDSQSPYESPAPYEASLSRENSPVSDDSEPAVRGERLGSWQCKVCDKTYKYVNAYKNHMRGHKQSKSSPSKRLTLLGPRTTQQKASRESSPDLGTFVMNNFLHEPDEPLVKRRSRIQKLPSTSPSHEPSPEIIEQKPRSRGRPKKIIPESNGEEENREEKKSGKRSRGRPRKKSRGRPSKRQKSFDTEELPPGLEGFCEVDVNKMLQSKSIFDEDSISQSAPSQAQSRSRSSSVELIQEFDIFGAATPITSPTPQRAYGSGVTFPCDVTGCSIKFHLRANLKKHRREVHGML